MSDQLTEREGALYAQARRDMLDDLIVEFDRYSTDPAAANPEAAGWAAGRLRATADRIARISGPLELPAAPCGIGTMRRDASLLCGHPAGHTGPHAWEWMAPDSPSLPGAIPWWRRIHGLDH